MLFTQNNLFMILKQRIIVNAYDHDVLKHNKYWTQGQAIGKLSKVRRDIHEDVFYVLFIHCNDRGLYVME